MARAKEARVTYKIKDFLNAPGVFEENIDIVMAAFYFEDKEKEITESEAKRIVKDFAQKKIN